MTSNNFSSYFLSLKTGVFLCCLVLTSVLSAQEVAILKYEGGGDWYANPTAVPNLIRFCNENIQTRLSEKPRT